MLSWERTWPYVLARALDDVGITADVINCGARARTIGSLNGADFEEHVSFKSPDVVVVQVGIVDCAPRVFTRGMKRILQSPRFPQRVRESLLDWVRSHRTLALGADPLARVYTKPDRFIRELGRFFERVAAVGTIHLGVLPIVGDLERLDKKSPGFSSNIEHYNRLLREACESGGGSLIRLSPDSSWFGADAYHLSERGSEEVARATIVWLRTRGLLPHEDVVSLQREEV